MIKHAMSYVQRSEKVRADVEERSDLWCALRAAELRLGAAESALVTAYGDWRDAMKQAADEGNELAKRYVAESEWDLT